MDTLKEAHRLWRLGFAVLWLYPKDKRPIGKEWTSGPRKNWADLKAQYRPGMNVGVRLGNPSSLHNGFLACVDIDIKDEKYREIALKTAQKALGPINLPTVSSGSGKGSRHYYGVSEEPFKQQTLGKEKGKWEVVAYSTGRQMVLPPSTHPTGRLYKWSKELELKNGVLLLPKFPFRSELEEASTSSKRIDKKEILKGFKVTPVKISRLVSLSSKIKDGILMGEGVSDRSAFLLPAARALFACELTKNQILTTLTNPNYFLGEVGYDHAKTKSRQKAAEWIWKFSVKKVFEERDPKTVFQGVEVVDRELPENEAKEQAAEFGKEKGFYTKGDKNNAPNYDKLLEAFKEEHPYRSIADMKTVFIFNGTHYESITPIEVKAFAEEKMTPRPSERVRTEFLAKIQANEVYLREFFIRSTEGRINFKNGVLDLRKDGKLHKHSKRFGFRGVLPYEFDPDALCPFFKKWFQSVMCEDEDLMKALQEFMGYIIRGGEYRFHKALWLEGAGRNGKSTFIDVLKALIGVGNFSTISIRSLVNDKFAGADLDGKIANFSEETSPEELKDSGPFKNLTGDGELYVQRKFGDPYSIRNQAKLVMTYNQIPDLKDLSPGMLSRPLIIPFRKNIKESEQDHSIKEKLCAELPGIFNFAMRGWRRLERQNHFTKSEKSEVALQKVREESCNVYQFVENYLEFSNDRDQKKKPTELYTYYKSVEKYPYTFISFARRISEHPVMKRRHARSNGIRYFWGIKPSAG